MTLWPSGDVQTDDAVVSLRVVGPRQAILLIDGMESSFHDLDDPTHLDFEYMQHMTAVLDSFRAEGTPIRALHLGGAGCSLATAWNAMRPGSTQVAIERDGELTRLAREWFNLPRAPRLKIRHADARQALEGFPENRWDVVVRDVFVKAEVPEHLSDAGTASAAHRVLGADGLYLVNLTDAPPLPNTRRELAILDAEFAHVKMVIDPAIRRGRRIGNVVLAASDAEFDGVELAKRLRRLPIPAAVDRL